jgi:hypothetical protein
MEPHTNIMIRKMMHEMIAKSVLSNLEEDEEKCLDEAEHGAAHEHHDQKDDAQNDR